MRSSMNVLKICHSVASKYLTSYAAGKEEQAYILSRPKELTFCPANFTLVTAERKNTGNKTIGGVRIILQQDIKRQ